jgi:hypothetical protein
MTRLIPMLCVSALAAGFGAAPAWAQAEVPASPPEEPTSTPAALAAHPAETPDDAAAALPLRRPVSAQTASHLADGVPQFTAPKPPEPKPDDGDSDSAETEKPKNGIIRLPDFVVSERPPPVFTKKDLLTDKALTQYIYKEHPGLNLWGLMPFASLNAPVAKQISEEEDRLSNISDLRDAAITIGRGGDASQDEYIKRQTQETFRHDVWGSGDTGDGK